MWPGGANQVESIGQCELSLEGGPRGGKLRIRPGRIRNHQVDVARRGQSGGEHRSVVMVTTLIVSGYF